jgi:hypothetical protein
MGAVRVAQLVLLPLDQVMKDRPWPHGRKLLIHVSHVADQDLISSLAPRQLAQAGIPLSIVEMPCRLGHALLVLGRRLERWR